MPYVSFAHLPTALAYHSTLHSCTPPSCQSPAPPSLSPPHAAETPHAHLLPHHQPTYITTFFRKLTYQPHSYSTLASLVLYVSLSQLFRFSRYDSVCCDVPFIRSDSFFRPRALPEIRLALCLCPTRPLTPALSPSLSSFAVPNTLLAQLHAFPEPHLPQPCPPQLNSSNTA